MSNKYLKHLINIIVVATPIIIFALLYFLLGKWPNYLFNDIDVADVYNLEKSLFGITVAGGEVLTPCEYFNIHHCAFMDILSGLLYLCWVPLPVIYAIVLQLQGHSNIAIRFTSAFLMVNLIGFAGYYIHPASPPWYVMQFGFEPIRGTPGNVAGFEHFDEIVGFPVFHSIYGKNANVFAAIPSLHAAYNVVTFYYAMKIKNNRPWQAFIGFVAVGIWFAAVYSGHHYIIDVTLGIITAIVGTLLFEHAVLRIPAVGKAYAKTSAWLSRKL